MERTSPSPLAQAFAALFDLLIAALAEHADEHPLLAPGIRASMRRIEQLAKKLDRMVAEWDAAKSTQAKQPPRKAGISLPPSRSKSRRMAPTRRSEATPSFRRSIPIWNPATIPRAPPRAPPLPDSRPALQNLRGQTGHSGAAPMYPRRSPRKCA
jgi:hypothetical protein